MRIRRKTKTSLFATVLVLLALMAGMLLSGCSVTDDTQTASPTVTTTAPTTTGSTTPATTATPSTPSTAVPDSTTPSAGTQPAASSPTTVQPADPATLEEEDIVLSLEGFGNAGALADSQLSILDMMTYALQDEYAARAEYFEIQESFGTMRPYDNIMRSEEKHIAMLKDLFAQYGLTVPEDDSADHVVIPASLLEAAETGVQAEINNIAMYEKFLTYTLPQDVADAFDALMSASESHLSPFENQVEKLS